MNQDQIQKLNQDFESKSAEEVIAWALKEYGQDLIIASSFSPEDISLIAMAVKVDPKVRVITLDTGRLNDETYQVMDAVRFKFGIEIETYFPKKEDVESLVRKKGFYSFRESIDNRKECCFVRKVEPLNRALSTAKAWMTGQRRSQAVTRGTLGKVENDSAHEGMVKINPLADWSLDDAWKFVKENKLPYNKLFDQGYKSVGCAPCTRAVGPEDDERAGRWWWENPEHKECGIHIKK